MKNEDINQNQFTVKKISIWTWILIVVFAFFTSVVPTIPFGNPIVDNSNNNPSTGIGGGPGDIFNKKVQISLIPVEDQLTDRTFFINLNSTQKLLVILDKGEIVHDTTGHQAKLNHGDLVDLNGVIKQVDSVSSVKNQLGLSSREAFLLSQQAVYFLATKANISQQ